MSIRVLKPGPLSSLQDLGRHGYQRFGVIVSGVMDEWSHRVANLLVGNPPQEATLEITLMGPSLVFERDALIAIAGVGPRIALGVGRGSAFCCTPPPCFSAAWQSSIAR